MVRTSHSPDLNPGLDSEAHVLAPQCLLLATFRALKDCCNQKWMSISRRNAPRTSRGVCRVSQTPLWCPWSAHASDLLVALLPQLELSPSVSPSWGEEERKWISGVRPCGGALAPSCATVSEAGGRFPGAGCCGTGSSFSSWIAPASLSHPHSSSTPKFNAACQAPGMLRQKATVPARRSHAVPCSVGGGGGTGVQTCVYMGRQLPVLESQVGKIMPPLWHSCA